MNFQRTLFVLLAFSSQLILAEGTKEKVKPERDPAYKLVWTDEFNKDGAPDPEKWISERGFIRNHEVQIYQPQNAYCKGGVLVLEARREHAKNPLYQAGSDYWCFNKPTGEYTSASLSTEGKYDWVYGRMEVRAKFQAIEGIWPAIWTTGRGRWPHAGEIDVMEYYQDEILANFCWAKRWGFDHWNDSMHPIKKFDKKTWGDKFHLWVVEWNEKEMKIYLDGHLLNSQDMSKVKNGNGPPINPFTKPHCIRLNLAVGAKSGDPAKTSFPQRYEIDYVRVWQKK